MVCNVEACAECTQNCLLIHGKKKDPSSIVTSFFKVMFGEDYSKVLFLPPKFARTVSALVDQTTHLEDSSGQRWTVTLSNLDGSFAFQNGWHEFSVDHRLKVGDFLVFNYIMESHFVVQIFGKHGCLKINIPEENGNRKKRTRTNRSFIAKDGPCHTIDTGSMNKQGSSTSVVSSSDIEMSESQPMATNNTSNLNNFETQRSRSGADGSNKVLDGDGRSPHHPSTLPRFPNEAGLAAKNPVAVEVVNGVAPIDVADYAMNEKHDDSPPMDKIALTSEKDSGSGHLSGHLLKESSVKPAENRNGAGMSNIVTKYQNAEQRSNTQSSNDQVLPSHKQDTPLMRSGQSAEQKFTGMSEFCGSPVSIPVPQCQSGKTIKVAKKEQVEMSEEVRGREEILHGKEPKVIKECSQSSCSALKDNDKVCKVVKTEPADSFHLSSLDAANISSSAVIENQAFLELPTCLPSISFSRTNLDRKVVLLRGQDTRLWSVLYHERYGLKVLTSGWEAFSKASSIQPGDECHFGVENESACIYQVSIVRK